MKKNRIIILIVTVLVAIVVIILARNQYSTLKEKESDFAVRDTASITKIFIADKKENSVLLERNESGWMLDEQFVAHGRKTETLIKSDCIRIVFPHAQPKNFVAIAPGRFYCRVK